MADRVLPGPVDSSAGFREAVCVHTSKVFDSCRDKDCIEDLRVYPTITSQTYIEGACSIRPRSAELLYVDVEVDEINFNRGFYTVDARFFYKVKGEVFPGCQEILGLAVFDKRVMLYGSEGSAKTFTSSGCNNCATNGNSLPEGVVEVVDPLLLSIKLMDSCPCPTTECDAFQIPPCVAMAFCEALVFADRPRNVFVTLGQFSIIRLERETNLIIPMFDYCMPEKECEGSTEEDPCTLFGAIPFPVEEFFPPDNYTISEEE